MCVAVGRGTVEGRDRGEENGGEKGGGMRMVRTLLLGEVGRFVCSRCVYDVLRALKLFREEDEGISFRSCIYFLQFSSFVSSRCVYATTSVLVGRRRL
jgi:hypothetical protein